MNWTLEYNPKVLVLSQGYMPIDVIPWSEAIKSWASGKADIVDHYSDETLRIRSGHNYDGERTVDMVCPSIIRMTDAAVSQYNLVIIKPLNRRSLFDNYHGKCCYCGRQLLFHEMTIEHIVPQSKGGLTTWQNCCPCCGECNRAKGDMTLEESGMTLQYKVEQPELDHLVPKNLLLKIGRSIPSETWRPYIYWEKTTNLD